MTHNPDAHTHATRALFICMYLMFTGIYTYNQQLERERCVRSRHESTLRGIYYMGHLAGGFYLVEGHTMLDNVVLIHSFWSNGQTSADASLGFDPICGRMTFFPRATLAPTNLPAFVFAKIDLCDAHLIIQLRTQGYVMSGTGPVWMIAIFICP
jgi:hypothetical protein